MKTLYGKSIFGLFICLLLGAASVNAQVVYVSPADAMNELNTEITNIHAVAAADRTAEQNISVELAKIMYEKVGVSSNVESSVDQAIVELSAIPSIAGVNITPGVVNACKEHFDTLLSE